MILYLIAAVALVVVIIERKHIQKAIRKTICWFIGCNSFCLWRYRPSVDAEFTQWECQRCGDQKQGWWSTAPKPTKAEGLATWEIARATDNRPNAPTDQGALE